MISILRSLLSEEKEGGSVGGARRRNILIQVEAPHEKRWSGKEKPPAGCREVSEGKPPLPAMKPHPFPYLTPKTLRVPLSFSIHLNLLSTLLIRLFLTGKHTTVSCTLILSKIYDQILSHIFEKKNYYVIFFINKMKRNMV